jgi:hypothetical protein
LAKKLTETGSPVKKSKIAHFSTVIFRVPTLAALNLLAASFMIEKARKGVILVALT